MLRPCPLPKTLGELSLVKWIFKNWIFTIGAVLILPVIYMLLFLPLGLGFKDNLGFKEYSVILLIISYPIFYLLCFVKGRGRERVLFNYGYWDLLPVLYFTVVFLAILVIGH